MELKQLYSRVLLLALSLIGALLVFLWLFVAPRKYRRGLEANTVASRSNVRWLILVLALLLVVGIIVEILWGIRG